MNDEPKINNRPGLPALAYRIGDWASFLSRMLTRLPSQLKNPDDPARVYPLSRLTTRALDDPAIALIDAWAVVADVLTFYQERIANEGFIKTATEQRSILELARAIGYELNPGVAASTFLAFTVDDAPGSPGFAVVPKGTQVVSIPGEDELPQTFETSGEIVARVEWNQLKPRPTKPQEINNSTDKLYLQGINTQLQAGDRILLIDDVPEKDVWYLLTLATVETITQAGYTKITWDIQLPTKISQILRNPKIFAFRQRGALFGYNAPKWQDMPNEVKRDYKGTIKGGIYRTANNGKSWTSSNTGLPITDIRCFARNSSNDYIFVGTAGAGIFRSTDDGYSWISINTGLSSLNIQTLYIDERNYILAGTTGGVFSSKDGGESWTPIHLGTVSVETDTNNKVRAINTALPNTVVRSLVSYASNKLAGTIEGSGITVSLNINESSRKLAVGDTIIADSQTKSIKEVINYSFTKDITVDSAFGGEFENLGYQLSGLPGIGTIRRTSETTATVSISRVSQNNLSQIENYLQNIKLGETITVTNDSTSKRISAVNSHQIIANVTVDSAFTNSLASGTNFLKSANYIFAGTDNNIYRTQDQGKNWAGKNLSNKAINSLITYNKNPDKCFLFAGTDDGVYVSLDNGESWKLKPFPSKVNASKIVTSLITYTDSKGIYYIFAGTKYGIFLSKDDGDKWEELDEIKNKIVNYLALNKEKNYIFAGTENGAFISLNDGNKWDKVNNGLANINVNSIVAYTKSVTGISSDQTTIAGSQTFTKLLKVGDIINFSNQTRIVTKIDDNILTLNEPLNFNLGSGSITFNIDYAFSGFAFTGFAEDEQKEWPNFQIKPKQDNQNQEIDLNNVYPKILPDTWIVLMTEDGNNAQPCKVENITSVQCRDFGLDVKVSRVEVGNAVKSDIFGLRSTIVLAESQALTLARENLTIELQQQKIFNDTIRENEIYLSEYVAGLLPEKAAIVSGKRIRVKFNNIGGVFSSQNNEWGRNNNGLTNTTVRTLVISTDGKLLLAGTEGGVFLSTDNGKNWEAVNEGLKNKDVRSLVITTKEEISTVYAGTSDGIFNVKIATAEKKWQAITSNFLKNPNVQALAVNKTNGTIFVGMEEGGVFSIIDGSDNLTQTALINPDIQALGINEAGDIFAGTSSSLYRFPNNGSSWEEILKDTNVTAIAFSQNQQILYVGTFDSGVLCSTNNGETWEQFNHNLTSMNIRSLAVSSNGDIFAGTASGGVFQLANNSGNWTPRNTGLKNIDVKAIALHENTIYAGGVGLLFAADGFSTVELKLGDILQVMSPPIDNRWHLRDIDGVEGFVETLSPKDITLQPATKDDEMVSEVCYIKTPPDDQQLPVLTFREPLKNSYDPTTTIIYANVASATHGETIEEVLGSGNGTLANQRFAIKKPPLTYVAAATPSGSNTTLEIVVDGVRWEEVASLYGLNNLDQKYITRIDDDGTTTITFGDGKSGARLPSGQENLVGRYRSGIGLPGNLGKDSLSLLKTRPLGIIEVTNPVPATGAAAREQLSKARDSAPLTVRTLDRIVSLQDFEDFARSFAGIGKAKTEVILNGINQIVHITVAAVGGDPVLTDSNLYNSLVKAIDAARDPVQVIVQVDSYKLLLFNLEAKILVDPRSEAKPVLAKVRTALQQRFAFENRDFGQPVTTSEAIATIQSIEGVVAVDLDALYLFGFAKALQQSLPASTARLDEQQNKILPAELLLLNVNGMSLESKVRS
ncbi:MAG: putative baseplate assembly protein [Cyanomargarita calcarea GSE-NOS-MK-12-04C]|jgi:photosystem II stability/assembly factor-like uncharacterized protein|uniref:Baseplate assembly protein n=1 Tax=Cyanomargarita calcarea GSE-NOS-MK-12-04C TaxID=2839659 RepID=A0A951QQX2_9CYAN|nr:putative baseplate assembly protein [Cyanomargarita calcarea GSE-NOS-MK-12-04C]